MTAVRPLQVTPTRGGKLADAAEAPFATAVGWLLTAFSTFAALSDP